MLLERRHPPLSVETQEVLPVEQLLLGRPVEEAAALLPRIFNLCRMTQEVAARLAFGLELAEGWANNLAQDVAREHAMKLGVMLPARLGATPMTMPKGTEGLPETLFGTDGFPESPDAFESFLSDGQGVAPMLRAVDQAFERDASWGDLPMVSALNAEQSAPLENSVAARHQGHPVLKHVQTTRGCGPLWRLVARALDLMMAVSNGLPQPLVAKGAVYVPAARGLYAVRATHKDGRVMSFRRVTPTDHLLAADGALEQSLSNLPAGKLPFAHLLIDILDPCTPVTLQEGTQHA